jgi:hypothetical protein
MDNKKLNEILEQLGGEKPTEDVHKLAEEISRQSVDVLSILRIPGFGRVRISLFRFAAAAAVIIFVFTFGFYTGKQSSLSQFRVSSLNSSGFSGQYLQQKTNKQSEDSFWHQKALAAMQSKPCSQIKSGRVNIIKAYRQYIQEKYND